MPSPEGAARRSVRNVASSSKESLPGEFFASVVTPAGTQCSVSRREDPIGKDPLREWVVVLWRLPWVVVVVGTFVFWHSGARAAALCERERFVSSGSLSLWPPGARCTFGEPAWHDTLLNPWFVGAVFVRSP